ncbi:hypothetical protein AAAU98_25900 [Enterocloster citroniae]
MKIHEDKDDSAERTVSGCGWILSSMLGKDHIKAVRIFWTAMKL